MVALNSNFHEPCYLSSTPARKERWGGKTQKGWRNDFVHNSASNEIGQLGCNIRHVESQIVDAAKKPNKPFHDLIHGGAFFLHQCNQQFGHILSLSWALLHGERNRAFDNLVSKLRGIQIKHTVSSLRNLTRGKQLIENDLHLTLNSGRGERKIDVLPNRLQYLTAKHVVTDEPNELLKKVFGNNFVNHSVGEKLGVNVGGLGDIHEQVSEPLRDQLEAAFDLLALDGTANMQRRQQASNPDVISV
mmetsp:Transcript_28944/g.67004  ORF Transcript_28944/g.67004 Transcript_28944/m.67004 type:complete len:246 (+) Transcript_28944:2039-2776(+)